MKKEVTPAMWAVAIIVAVLVLGFIGWRAFGPSSSDMDQATINAHIAAKRAKEASQ